jgi:hypothetical protein
MFTWICPQCGREVPPAYNECPDCSPKNAAGAAPPAGAFQAPPPPAPPQPGSYPPQAPAPAPGGFYPPQSQQPLPQGGFYPPQSQSPQAPPQGGFYTPQAQQPVPAPGGFLSPQATFSSGVPTAAGAPAKPQTYLAPSPSGGLPIWALTIVFVLGILVIGGGIIWLFGGHNASTTTSAPAPKAPVPAGAVNAPQAPKPAGAVNALQKYVEVAGVRFAAESKSGAVQVKFLVINHSEADIVGLAANVAIFGQAQNGPKEQQGTFTFTGSLGPMESKELTAPLNTKSKIYELPDWQNISTEVQVTAP